jgi:hypothetical protein
MFKIDAMPEQNSNTPNGQDKPSSLLSRILRSKEFLVTATSIITGIGFFYKLLEKPVKDINVYSLVIEALNIIILIIGLIIFSRKYSFNLPEKKDDLNVLIQQEVSHSADTHNGNVVIMEEKISTRVKQVSRLVYQLLNTFKGFAVCLILLYAFLFLSDLNHKKEVDNSIKFSDNLKDSVRIIDAVYKTDNFLNKPFLLWKDTSAIEDSMQKAIVIRTMAGISTDSEKRNSFNKQIDSLNNTKDSEIERMYRDHTSLVELIMTKDPLNEIVVNEIIVSIVDNFFNVLSTAFLLMAFYILYHQKVDISKDDVENYQSSNNYWMPLLIAIIIILLGTLVIITGFCQQNLQSLIVWMRITSGIFNGVGMLLLVSRFISMEYLYKQSDDVGKNFYLIGTTVILPIYVVVQPLWGIFQVNIENKEVLKQIIMMLCLWGKIFFIMIVYYMLNNRWLHTYIYMMPVAEERMKLVTEKFDDLVVNIKTDN